MLERLGFIRIKQVGNQKYRYVLLVHPAAVVEKLHAQGKVSQNWIDSYSVRQIETKETTLAERKKAREAAAKVVNIKDSQRAGKKAAAPKAG